MILFVFEGQKAEPMVFKSLEQLFFSGEEFFFHTKKLC